MKKNLLSVMMASLVGFAGLTSSAQANLLITEINSNASGGDFWEVTNFGTSTINLTGWSWDDDSDVPGSVPLPAGSTFAANEVVVFLASAATESSFRSIWNIPSSVQIFASPLSPGLGQNDRVTLFDNLNASVVTFDYAANGFIRSNGSAAVGGHAGISAGGTQNQSAIWDPTSGTTPETARYTFAVGDNFDTYFAPGGNGVGSPGLLGIENDPDPIPEPSTYALLGLGLVMVGFWYRRRAIKV